MIAHKQSCAVHLGLVVVGLVASCGTRASPAPECQFAPAMAVRVAATEDQWCEPWDCGTNTPNVYENTAIDVVRLTAPTARILGTPTVSSNPYVEPGSLQVATGACAAAAEAVHVGVEDGALVGMNSDGQAVCTGDELTNARFNVRVGSESFEVRVSTIGKVFTWELDETKRRSVATYRFTTKQGPAVCRARAWMEDWQIANLRMSMWRAGFTPPTQPIDVYGKSIEPPDEPAGVPPLSWATPTEEAVLYQGETYSRYADIDKRGDEWINIGCAGSGIAKMRLMGFNPKATGAADTANRASTEDRRVATAKMITARYRGETSYTQQGMPLLWLQWNGINYYGDPSLEDTAIGPIESHWGADGASCLSHLREARQCFMTQDEEAMRQMEINLGSCDDGTRPTPSTTISAYQMHADKSVWTTFTYTHVDP